MNKETNNSIDVVFINPGNVNDAFWSTAINFMKAVARDLNINLIVKQANDNHLRMIEIVEEIAKSTNKPDYLLISNEKSSAQKMLEIADKAEIQTMLVMNGLTQAQKQKITRHNHENWLGSMVPDNEKQAFIVTRYLIEKANRISYNNLHMVSINGTNETPASIDREQGMENALQKYGSMVIFHQKMSDHWQEDKAFTKARVLLGRYPQTNIIWAANASMAIGASKAAREANKIPGKDIVIGGFDITEQSLRAVKDGSLDVTIGGHFMIPGWALVVLYDDFNKINNNDELTNDEMIITGMNKVDSNNIGTYINKLDFNKWDKINFKVYSKYLNPKRNKYNFTLDLNDVCKP